MPVSVKIPTQLRAATDGESIAEVDGTTVGEVLDSLYERYGELRSRIAEDGGLRRFVNVYVGGEDIRFLDGLETPVADGDEVTILPAVAGGEAAVRGRPSGRARPPGRHAWSASVGRARPAGAPCVVGLRRPRPQGAPWSVSGRCDRAHADRAADAGAAEPAVAPRVLVEVLLVVVLGVVEGPGGSDLGRDLGVAGRLQPRGVCGRGTPRRSRAGARS